MILEIRIALVVIFGLGIFGLGLHYMDLRERAAQGEIDRQKLEAVEGITKDAQEASVDRQLTENTVAISREEYQRLLSEATRNDPVLAERADAAFPERLRELAQQRRLARERSRGAASGDRE